MLGNVTKEELEQYRQIDPKIERFFRSTFSAGLPFSHSSLFLGGGLLAFGTIFNLSITHRLLSLVGPPLLSYVHLSNDARAEHHTGQFLDWVLEKRKAESFLEVHASRLNTDKIKSLTNGSSNVLKQYQDLVLSHISK